MASEHWFRWYHGTVTDPKWRVIAARASHAMSRDVTVCHVVSVWSAMMECASQAEVRGELQGWCSEDVAMALGITEAEVDAIKDAMQGKTLEGDTVSAWNKRQPKKEDPSASERKRAQREREKSVDTSDCHAMSRDVTKSHVRGEESIKNPPTPRKRGKGFDALAYPTPEWLSPDSWRQWVKHRAETKHPLTESTCAKQIEALARWQSDGHDPAAILDQSIRNGWQGLFEPKDGVKSNGASVSAPPQTIALGKFF